MKRVRYETQAIQSACSKVQKNEISWWARRKYKLFEWLGRQKKSRLGVSWVLELIPTEFQSLFQGGLVSKPPGEGRDFFFFLKKPNLFFLGRTPGDSDSEGVGLEPRNVYFLKYFPSSNSRWQLSTSLCLPPPLPPQTPPEINRGRTKWLTHSSEENRKTCKEVRASTLLLKIRERTEACWKQKTSIGSYEPPPWEQDAEKAMGSDRATEKLPNWRKSEWVMNNATKIKSNDERSV